MAKKKADYLKEAKDLGLELSVKSTIADIRAAIDQGRASVSKDFESKEVPFKDEKEVKTKAGRHSAKGLREAEAKQIKEARKAGKLKEKQDTTEVKKGPTPIARPQIERRGKKYRILAKKIDQSKSYSLEEAINLAIQTASTKFDSTVELHVNTNADPKMSNQNIRETVNLPHGTGKTVRVAVFTSADLQKSALEAGADIVGEQDLLELLKKSELNFDVLIASPRLMSQLGQYAKLLGPKGLMPNPKSGTVTNDIPRAVKNAKQGQVEFRLDKQAIIHVGVGKVSFGDKKLLENLNVVLDSIKSAKPSGLKGPLLSSIYITTSMGPSIKVSI
jgi:large subunit ribosomal protein L1